MKQHCHRFLIFFFHSFVLIPSILLIELTLKLGEISHVPFENQWTLHRDVSVAVRTFGKHSENIIVDGIDFNIIHCSAGALT